MFRAEDLDVYDWKLLDAVAADGRISVTALAEKIGLSSSPTQVRLKRLEAEGLILGYRALLDPVRLGRAHLAFVEVKLDDTREKALAAFNERVTQLSAIEECHLVASRFDYLLKVRCASMTEYRLTLAEHISQLPHLAHTSTYVVMQAIKDESVGFSLTSV